MAANKRIVILGGGVIGLCTAWYCLKRGHEVVVVDRRAADHAGCSHGNAGMIVPSHFVPLAAPGMVALGLKWMWDPASPFYIKPRLDPDLIRWGMKFWRAATKGHVDRSAPLLRDLSFASRGCFEELDREWGAGAAPGTDPFGLVRRGLVMLCRTRHALDEEAAFAARANAIGVPAEVLDARQTAALDPDVTMDVAGSVYFPRDCHLHPGRFMEELRARIGKAGGQFLWETEVAGFRIERDRHVYAAGVVDGGEVAGDEFVVCGGAWSAGLARALGLRLPMQAGKGYSLTLPAPRQLPRLCSILSEARVAVTPMGGALRFGGTMEIAGLNEDINPVRVRGIIAAAQRYFPAFAPADFQGVEPWCGLRPCSPDGLPYLGRMRRLSNVTVATGHAMMGVSLGPITGRLVSEILSGEAPSHDLTLLDPQRHG